MVAKRLVKAKGPKPIDEMTALEEIEKLYVNGVVIDTETTGVSGPGGAKPYGDTIAEVAVVRIYDKALLYHSYVRPETEFDAEALEATGFDVSKTLDAPSWKSIYPEVIDAVAGHTLTAWNARFDVRLIHQSCQSVYVDSGIRIPVTLDPKGYRTDLIWAVSPSYVDAMALWGRYRGRSYRTALATALESEGLSWEGAHHTAVADCMAVASVIRKIIFERDPEVLLSEAKYDAAAFRRLRERCGFHPEVWAERFAAKGERLARAGYADAAEIMYDLSRELGGCQDNGRPGVPGEDQPSETADREG